MLLVLVMQMMMNYFEIQYIPSISKPMHPLRHHIHHLQFPDKYFVINPAVPMKNHTKDF